MTDTTHLVEVRLLGVSLADYQDASAHHDELFREFALVLADRSEARYDVPGRLLSLIEELTERFGGFGAESRMAIDEALARGDEAIDLVYRVPPETAEAIRRVGKLLAEADEYCQRGELLTVAPPPPAIAFRDWFLGEFTAQSEGRPPTSWPDYRANINTPN